MTMKKEKNNYSKKTYRISTYLKFIIPSVIGIVLFMLPIKSDGDVTIPVAVLSNVVSKFVSGYISMILVGLISISFLGSVLFWGITLIKKDSKLKENSFLASTFLVKPIWFIIRGIAFVFIWIVYYEKGISAIYSKSTGGLVFHDLLPILFSVFLLASLFLPLLLNFGLLEFTGTLLIKIMKPVFGLPGRSAIDAIASWLGDGTVGVLLTSKQYEQGFYTEKEACVIGTNFSLVSITFSLVVINTVGLPNMFVPFYLTVTIACIIAAIVIPKFPPLSRKKNRLIDGSEPREEKIPSDMTGVSYGCSLALQKVENKKVIKSIVVDGCKNVVDMWISVLPIVMTVGTVALLIAEYTPIFRVLGLPFLPLLKLLQIPEAVEASQTLFAGFADMLLPAVLISEVPSELTRFVVAAVSVTQLIYLSEVGALLIASKIPVKLSELFVIFIERTIVTLPVIALIAHIIF